MSKRRHLLRDQTVFNFEKGKDKGRGQAAAPPTEEYDTEDTFDENFDSGEMLDEAHEALSKLFTKTNKRAKQLRGVRRKDAWQ